jgi:hypothetical protein
MSSYSIPEPAFRAVTVRSVPRSRRDPVATEGRSMIKMLGWAATILAVCLLVWQASVDVPIWPRLLSAVFLILIGTLAGIRIGAGGAANYIRDVHRLNKVLAEQHRELEELNSDLLKQINAEIQAPASSQKS